MVVFYTRELPLKFSGAGAGLVDIDTALQACGVLIVLVGHDEFRVVRATRQLGGRPLARDKVRSRRSIARAAE